MSGYAPDPNLPDHQEPVEPITWTLARIEAAAELLSSGPHCQHCEMRPGEIHTGPGGVLPAAVSWNHQADCPNFWG